MGWGGWGGGQTPPHFLLTNAHLLSAPVPNIPPTPPPPRSQIQFWSQCYASGREVSKNLILVGTIIIFQRHRTEHQPFADDSQLRQSSHPSMTDQTLLSFHGCVYDTNDWLTTLANRRQDWSNAISFIKSPRPTYIFIHLLNYCCHIFCSLIRNLDFCITFQAIKINNTWCLTCTLPDWLLQFTISQTRSRCPTSRLQRLWNCTACLVLCESPNVHTVPIFTNYLVGLLRSRHLPTWCNTEISSS